MAEVKIPFKKLLDSTVLAEYDSLTDSYTLKVSWAGWGWWWGWGDTTITDVDVSAWQTTPLEVQNKFNWQNRHITSSPLWDIYKRVKVTGFCRNGEVVNWNQQITPINISPNDWSGTWLAIYSDNPMDSTGFPMPFSAKGVEVKGVNSLGNEISEIVAMNWTVPVSLVNDYYRINDIRITNWWTNMWNIKISESSWMFDLAYMPASYWRLYSSMYHVPTWYVMFITSMSFWIQSETTSWNQNFITLRKRNLDNSLDRSIFTLNWVWTFTHQFNDYLVIDENQTVMATLDSWMTSFVKSVAVAFEGFLVDKSTVPVNVLNNINDI